MMMKMQKPSGFTLAEILIATVVLAAALVGTLALFTRSLSLARGSGVFTIAQFEAERQMEEIYGNSYSAVRNGDIDEGIPAYTDNGGWKATPFTLQNSSITGSGVVYGEEIASGLLSIRVVVCYRQGERIIGEDNGNGSGTALDGIVNGAEDVNGNNELDSPCQFKTVVVDRGL
jgi:prepilin-type N-terminal cleavage/methylation domain-containing protein